MHKLFKKSQLRKSPPLLGPSSSSLTLAELSLQRGDFDHGRAVLERRIGQGANDFKTLNLYGVSLAHSRHFDNACTIFQQLRDTRLSKAHRIKAVFNMGLAQFYQELTLFGDQTIASYTQPVPSLPLVSLIRDKQEPFTGSIATWKSLLTNRTRYPEIIHTYLSFAYLQQGKIANAFHHLIEALAQHEVFYVTHYVLGRIFLDLFLLSTEGNDYSLSKDLVKFFEIEEYEIAAAVNGLSTIHPDTLLDISLQAFLEGRNLSPLAVEMYLSLCRTYLLGGFYDEAHETLTQLESMVPDSPMALEIALTFHERVQSPPAVIQSLVNRIKKRRGKKSDRELYLILPPYYLF